MAVQQAAHDDALASSQEQINQLLAAFAATTTAAHTAAQSPVVPSDQMLAVPSGQDLAAAAANTDLPCSQLQQGDCPAADADSTARANTSA